MNAEASTLKSAIEDFIRRHGISAEMEQNLVKEAIHLHLLSAMSDAGILRHAVFQGGTALRLCYDGERAEALIPKIRYVIENFKFRAYGDHNAWPGPNSNTFVQVVLDSVPELRAVLPPTAVGKDFPYNGRWIGVTSSGTGVYVSLAGYVGLTVGWVEGFEVNFFGAVIGFDIRRPALKLPGIGRIGIAAGL